MSEALTEGGSNADPEAAADLTDADPFIWLEDVLGERALAWVRERNAESQAALETRPGFNATRDRLLALMNSNERIPQVSRRGDHFYNLWQDAAHPRGIWRRTTLAEYRQSEPAWDEVLDLDALATHDGENWVWGGATSLAPEHRRVLIKLSRGGADAAVVREFDTVAKRFVDVGNDGGFALPEAKSRIDWLDENTVYVGTDFGPGSLTDAGYPRIVKRWSRGTPLGEAVTVYEAQPSDLSATASVDATPGHERSLIVRAIDFYRADHFLLARGELHRIAVPADASISFWNSAADPADTLLIELRSDWEIDGHCHAGGSLLAADARHFLAGERRLDVLFAPTATRSLSSHAATRSHLILNILDNVASRLEAWQRTPTGFVKRAIDVPCADTPGTLSVRSLHDTMLADDPLAEHCLLGHSGFLTPDTLFLVNTGGHVGSHERETLKSLPPRFDSSGMHAEQCVATSADGTRVPYFIVWPAGVDASHPADGSTPTLLYGYGGFEVSLRPWYPSAHGSAWLAHGGVLVVANIRGGGEFGPAWHQAAIGARKQRSFDDFIAVAEDLIARRITDSAHLGIQGGSNGGLLVGAAFTQRPDLFNAVVCSVPLLDMRRYHKLLAGASWMAEYGDPDDPAQWAFISAYSPYQRLRADLAYPEVLFTTSTRDDRVHPAHARKMAARMLALGHPVLYHENTEGGHGGAADNAQRAHVQALEMSYLWRQLGGSAE